MPPIFPQIYGTDSSPPLFLFIQRERAVDSRGRRTRTESRSLSYTRDRVSSTDRELQFLQLNFTHDSYNHSRINGEKRKFNLRRPTYRQTARKSSRKRTIFNISVKQIPPSNFIPRAITKESSYVYQLRPF